jgi:hypothetical protein
MDTDLTNVPDFSDITCTNLQIRLMMLLKNARPDSTIQCFVRRDQRDTINAPFTKTGYDVKIRKVDGNRYLARLKKKTR